MNFPESAGPAPVPDRITLVALAVAAGAAAGCALAGSNHAAPLLLSAISALALLTASTLLASRSPAHAFMLLVMAAAPLATSWTILRLTTEPDPRITAFTDVDQPRVLLTIEGRITQAPRRVTGTADRLAPLWHRQGTWALAIDVHAFIDDAGHPTPSRGRWTIALSLPPDLCDDARDDALQHLNSGRIVRATGRVLPPRTARHPGERDPGLFRRSAGRVATLAVPDPALIACVDEASGGSWITRLRGRTSSAAHRALTRNLGDPGEDAAAALCTALMLGRYEAGGDTALNAMRRIGLAHLLAISGLHVGLITGGALLFLRSIFRPTRFDGVAILGVLALYLLLVEWRVPVLRAALMSAAIAVGLVAARRWRVRGLLSLSAIVLLLHRPEQIMTAGFQLSFGVVLALIQFAPALFNRLNPLVRPPRGSLRGLLCGAFAASTVAWLTALPMTAWHFGVISPLSIPLSILGLPVIALLLLLGFAKMITGAVAGAIDGPLTEIADTLLAGTLRGIAGGAVHTARWIDALPGSSIHCDPPHGLLVASIVLWTALRLSGRLRLGAARRRVIDLLLITLLVTPVPREMPGLRIDTIAVGDGSCHLVRSAGRTLLFDAGSASLPDAGQSVILPVLQALGVRSIDLLFISHADLDHFSAVPEILDALPVRRVLLSHDFCHRARIKGGSAEQLLMDLERRRLAIERVDDQWSRSFGEAHLSILHPAEDDLFASDNDASLVLHICAPGGSVLLTGDIEQTAIERLHARHPNLRADILELPHHGSAQPGSEELVARLQPRVVLQSTGPRRLRRDVWEERLKPRTLRLITARDGSVSVELHDDGRTVVRRHGRLPERPARVQSSTMTP